MSACKKRFRRGTLQRAPTTDHDDSMHVVGRGDKGLQCNQREIVRDGAPGLPLCEIRVILVLVPAGGIPLDVFADGHQFLFVSDDVFVIPALPDGRARSTAQNVDSQGGGGFEQANDGGNGIRCGLGETFRLRRGTLQRAPTGFADYNEAV